MVDNVIAEDAWAYANANGIDCQDSLGRLTEKRAINLRIGYPPFLFFFPHIASGGVFETRQVALPPFWTSIGRNSARLIEIYLPRQLGNCNPQVAREFWI